MQSGSILRVFSISEVASFLGVHVTTIHRWCTAGNFPPKVRLGPGRVGFLSSDVEAWLAQRRDFAN